MSVEQLESDLRKLSQDERRRFAEWFDTHREELVPNECNDLSENQKAELLQRRREYEEHPERFLHMDKQSLDRMFGRIRKNVATHSSSAH